MLRGECMVVEAKERTDFQRAFLRVHSQITHLKSLHATSNIGLVYCVHNPPSSTKIPALECLLDLDVKGTRLEVYTKEELPRKGHYLMEYTLRQVFADKNILERFAIIFMGPNGSSGFGKSSTARGLAKHYSACYVDEHSLPRSDAQTVLSNTLDAIRKHQWKPGQTWLIDDWKPADGESTIYITENMLKVMFNRSEPCSFRARNEDVIIPAAFQIIITANADSMKSWLGYKIPASEPILRKCIVFDIREHLLGGEWLTYQSPGGSEHQGDAPSLMTARLDAACARMPVRPVVPLSVPPARAGCPVRFVNHIFQRL